MPYQLPFFPTAPAGLTWKGKKLPGFNSLPLKSQGGRDEFISTWQQPVWRWDLDFSYTKQGRVGADLKPGLQRLMAFYNACRGSWANFIYRDPDDYYVPTTAPVFIGTGDGTTTNFQLNRVVTGPSGTFVEPVFYVPMGSASLGQDFAPGISPTDPSPIVYDNGTSMGFQNSIHGGTVALNFTPAAGHTLTWSGTYYFICHFLKDTASFSEFMLYYWSEQMSFETTNDTSFSLTTAKG